MEEKKLLSIQSLEISDNRQAIYESETLDALSSMPAPHCNGPRYSSRKKPSEPDQACWRLTDSKGPFDLHKFLDEFCHWYDRTIDRKGYCLTTAISPDLPRFFQGKQLMLGFLLWDIASYSQVSLGSGGAGLEVEWEPFSGNWCSIYFTLTVPGLGIPLEKEKALFLPADRNGKKSSGSRASANLYYAGMIAGLFGGRVHVQNSIGFGVEYCTEIRLLKKPD